MTQQKEIFSGSVEKVSSSLLNPELLKSSPENLFKSYSVLQKEYGVAIQKITSLEEEISRLKEQLQLMQHRLFGKKSEVFTGEPVNASNPDPLSSSNPDPIGASEEDEVVSVSAHKRKKRGRILDTKGLHRVIQIHDLPETEKFCSCCHHPLAEAGKDVSEQLEIIPAKIYVVEHQRIKYTCRHCQTLRMAPKPLAPVPKALAGGSLLTEIIVSKYAYHLPLYRQSKMLQHFNVDIPDNTLGNWIIQSGNALMPLYEALWKVVLKQPYLQVDETPVKILKSDKKGYLWAYFALHASGGLIIFELSLTRGGTVAENRLSSFKGILQTDGYRGYDNLRDREDITSIGCLTHARRKFAEILKITRNLTGIAAEFVERVQPLYALEDTMKKLKFSFHSRKRYRQKFAFPVLIKLRAWLKIQSPKVPPNSKLGTAIQYFLNQWEYIIAYTNHGLAEIDTNWVENKIRPLAVGRKNWLFMSDQDNGTIHALFYSLIASAEQQRLNPRVYILYVLSQVHEMRKKTVDPASLLPHVIDRKKLEVFAQAQISLANKIFKDSS